VSADRQFVAVLRGHRRECRHVGRRRLGQHQRLRRPTGLGHEASKVVGEVICSNRQSRPPVTPEACRRRCAAYRRPSTPPRQRVYDVGFEPGSESLDRTTPSIGTSPSGFTARPSTRTTTGDQGRHALLPHGSPAGTITACDVEHDYASRPQMVKGAVACVSLTGKSRRPMITLHGDIDGLLPIWTDSDVFTSMIVSAGKRSSTATAPSRTTTTSTASSTASPARCGQSWELPRGVPAPRVLVTDGVAPPARQTVTRPESGDVANTCPQLAATSGERQG
jgi:hypothetical protein